jgi:hypothetical protein
MTEQAHDPRQGQHTIESVRPWGDIHVVVRPFHMLVVSFGEWRAEDQEHIEDDYGRKGQEVSSA